MEAKLLKKYTKLYDRNKYKSLTEEMTFAEYLHKVQENPRLVRTAFQYIGDMILSYGMTTFERHRKTLTRYHFFDTLELSDPIFGIEETLDNFVNFVMGAAGKYGTERRVLLLHGPVGSSKSTICRRLKRGLEAYSQTPAGAWYSYKWIDLPSEIYTSTEDACPMHEDPVRLMPQAMRDEFFKDINQSFIEKTSEEERYYSLSAEGGLCPRCQQFMDLLLAKYEGDWEMVVNKHIKVVRLTHNEARRVGIGTFQPKDEKNQDATELTGDLNFAKVGHFGKDSDARAFNFDGEFNVANRGVIEFIEMLKLEVAFLYDLLGTTQEHQIKPKKFSQVSVDEFIVGHSVHGSTPVPHEYDGVLDVLPIEEMSDLDVSKLKVFSVNVETRQVELSPVKSVFSHQFGGDWVVNKQNDDELTTTPNHSVYNTNLEKFYPGEDTNSEIVCFQIPPELIADKPQTVRWLDFFAYNKEVQYV